MNLISSRVGKGISIWEESGEEEGIGGWEKVPVSTTKKTGVQIEQAPTQKLRARFSNVVWKKGATYILYRAGLEK